MRPDGARETWVLIGVLAIAAGLSGGCSRGRALPAGVGAEGPLACPPGAQLQASEIPTSRGGGHQERCMNAAGLRHGPSRGFFPDGQIRYYTEWSDGKKTGKFATWWPNGQQKAEGAHRDWEPNGVWTNWDETGKVTSQHDYATGPYPSPTAIERSDDAAEPAPG